MDELLIFCFKSCLKGENDKEYYRILEIDDYRHCTQEDIKRQFKRLSLNLHPDKLAQRGIENTLETRQKFVKVKEAYDVLSDPRKRRIYDSLGELGIKILDKRASEINPMELLRNFQRNGKHRFSIYLCILFVFACLFLLPVLFSLKADGTLGSSAPWVAIWSPMWLVDIFILVTAVMILCIAEVQETTEEGETVTVERIPLTERLSSFALTVLFVLLQIFILVKLDGDVSWSWFGAFIPWFIYEGLSALLLVPVIMKTVTVPVSEGSSHLSQPLSEEDGSSGTDGEAEEEKIFQRRLESDLNHFKELWQRYEAREQLLIHGLRLWLAIFLALKLDQWVAWDWGLVLLPIWIFFVVKAASNFLLRRWAEEELEGVDSARIMAQLERDPANIARHHKGAQLSSVSNWSCVLQCTTMFMALMLISRLDVSSFSTFLILLPIFIITGCCCCAVCCGVMCLANVDLDAAEEQIKQQQQQQQGSQSGGVDEDGVRNGPTYNPPTTAAAAVYMMDDNGQPGAESPAYGAFGIFAMSGMNFEEGKHQSTTDYGRSKAEGTAAVAAPTSIDPDID